MSWFYKHLNWTWVLAMLSACGILLAAWAVVVELSNLDVYLPDSYLEFIFNLSITIWISLTLLVSGWVLVQKRRSLWWLLLFIIGSHLWLRLRKTENNRDKPAQAYELAKDAGLISLGKLTEEYRNLIMEVTGKTRMADMTPEEADRFIEALGKLVANRQIQRVSWLEDPWSRVWTWIVVFALITACLFMIDHLTVKQQISHIIPRSKYSLFGGYTEEVHIIRAPLMTAVLAFNMCCAAIMRRFIKRHGRNSAAWTTAIVVFTPILAGIAYLLTWPKTKGNSA